MSEDLRKKFLREEYKSRINKVQDYIEANVGEELTVLKLSQIANFSPYHFHRIFSALTGEPLYQHIQRIRLEKSAYILLTNPKKSITQIALECGFMNQASFARAFKKYFNMSAGEWRINPNLRNSKNCKVESKSCKTDSNLGKDLLEDIPYSGKYAAGHFKIRAEQYQDAWDAMFGKWFPESGYQPDDGACFELYLNNPDEHPENIHVVDICVPVKPL